MVKADFVRNRETIRHLIEKVHAPERLSVAQHNAISNACALMQKQHADERLIAVLGYHIEKPDAFIFRDANTMQALRAAEKALTREIERLERGAELHAERAAIHH